MKKFLKILGIIVGVGVVVIIGGVIYLYAAFPKVSPPSNIKVDATPERLARGKYLANHVVGCVDCHSVRDWNYFAGPITPGTEGKGGERFGEELGFPGNLYATNITPAGLGNWTDGEMIRAITAGVNKDGRALFSLMPYLSFAQLSQEDLYSIVAYIRSLPPIQNSVPASTLNFPMNLIVRTIPRDAKPDPAPDTSDMIAYGKYLVTIGACTDCHTPAEKGQPLPGMDYAGGFAFLLPDGNIVRSANITSDNATGIGGWTKEFFIKRFKLYDNPEAQKIPAEKGKITVMPWTALAGITERDLGAMYSYLRTIHPVKNKVEKFGKKM